MTLLALRYLQTIGYVHRDVSAGNYLFYRGAGKLADLEYSKFYEDISVSEPRTVSIPYGVLIVYSPRR